MCKPEMEVDPNHARKVADLIEAAEAVCGKYKGADPISVPFVVRDLRPALDDFGQESES